MKRILSLRCALTLCLPARAESRCTLPELPGAISPHWQQTWEAHGRTITVEEDILIPMAAAVPLLMVRRAAPGGTPAGRAGPVFASAYSDDVYALTAWLYAEAAVVREDTPLVPFDEVRGQVEALIASGHVRAIDSVGLGYVQFDTAERDVQLLAPAWVIWCEYLPGGAEAERERPLYTDGLLQDSDCFRPLIIPTETGRLIDPESEAEGRCLYPGWPESILQ